MVSKIKPSSNINERKIKAQHHKHSKSYLKTYWPYIPIVSIISLGVIIHIIYQRKTLSSNVNLTNYSFLSILESTLGLLALTIFLLRHAFAWHKVFVKGEEFATKHPYLDILLVTIATIGILLNHSIATTL